MFQKYIFILSYRWDHSSAKIYVEFMLRCERDTGYIIHIEIAIGPYIWCEFPRVECPEDITQSHKVVSLEKIDWNTRMHDEYFFTMSIEYISRTEFPWCDIPMKWLEECICYILAGCIVHSEGTRFPQLQYIESACIIMMWPELFLIENLDTLS